MWRAPWSYMRRLFSRSHSKLPMAHHASRNSSDDLLASSLEKHTKADQHAITRLPCSRAAYLPPRKTNPPELSSMPSCRIKKVSPLASCAARMNCRTFGAADVMMMSASRYITQS